MSRTNFVCFACRRALKGAHASAARCPTCGKPATNMGVKFRVPPRHAENQWRKVETLVSAGVVFNRYAVGAIPRAEMPVRTYAQAKRVAAALRVARDASVTQRPASQARVRAGGRGAAGTDNKGTLRMRMRVQQLQAIRNEAAKGLDYRRVANAERTLAQLERRLGRRRSW